MFQTPSSPPKVTWRVTETPRLVHDPEDKGSRAARRGQGVSETEQVRKLPPAPDPGSPLGPPSAPFFGR